MSKWNKVSDMKRLSRMVMPLDAIEGLPDNHVISVTERTIEIDESELVQNNVSTDTYTLELDAEWDGITPVVIFSNSQGDYQVAYENGPTKIPAAVMAVVGSVDVSVFGLDSTGAVRVVTKAAPNTMTVVESGKFVGEVSEDDISLLGQLLAAAEAATEAAANANATIIKSAVATTLEPGEPATANIADNVLTIGVPKGEKGDKGDQGDPGQDGVTPFTQATVTTLEPDSPATVAIEEDTLKLEIPKGEKGDKGDTGDQGPQGEPGQDGQDATLPEGMVTADGIGTLSRLGSDGEPSVMTNVIVGNTANGNSAAMNTSGNSPSVSVMNSQTKAGVGFGLVDGEPVLSAGKSQSDQKVYGFSPTIPEDDSLTVVTSDAYKADTDPLKQRIAELEQQTQNVVTGTSTGLVAHGEDAFPQKPREVRVKGKTWVNRWPKINGNKNGITVSTDETGLFHVSGTATSDAFFDVQVVGVAAGKQVTLIASAISNVGIRVEQHNADGNMGVSYRIIATTTGATDTLDAAMTELHAVISVSNGTTVNASFRVMLVDGTEAPDCFTPPASITSAQPENLVTSGKNLVNTSGASVLAANYGVKLPNLTLQPGTYVVKRPSGLTGNFAIYRDGDTSSPVSAISEAGVSFTLTSPIHGFDFRSSEANQITLDNVSQFQLELGSTATAYEPPAVTTTPLPEVELRGLPNGTCDELVIKADGTCEVERWTGYIASYADEEVTGEYVSTGNGLEAGASIVYELDEPTTEPQSPVILPALPAPTFNQYHDSPVPSDTSTEYARDINLVLANLEAVQAALLGGE